MVSSFSKIKPLENDNSAVINLFQLKSEDEIVVSIHETKDKNSQRHRNNYQPQPQRNVTTRDFLKSIQTADRNTNTTRKY